MSAIKYIKQRLDGLRPVCVLVVLFLFSCGPGESKQQTVETAATPLVAAPPAYDKTLAIGKVTDSVLCRADNSQSYALYLPPGYTPDKHYPCIYFFDAHAHGALPVRRYKVLAEQYGFIMIGSNSSQNGIAWQQTQEIVKVLMEDSRMRINIDPQRIYACGFSGGAKVAGAVAATEGDIAGVIGCAAGFTPAGNNISRKPAYFSIAGVYDFNYTDMRQLDEALGQNGFNHQLLTFGGKHEWPPVDCFKSALLWMQANAIKENIQPKNDSLVQLLKSDYESRITAASKTGDAVYAHSLLAGMIQVLTGLTDMADAQKKLTALTNSDAFKKGIARQQQLQAAEQEQQQELAKQFAAQNEHWWAQKITGLEKDTHSAKTPQEKQLGRRLLNFTGFIGYMSTDRALNQGDVEHAAAFLKIFKLADPQNPDQSYLTATLYMKKGDQPQAIAALNQAAALGYSDVTKLTTDPAFGALHNDARFADIVDKVIANANK